MKDKNLPLDNTPQSLEELTKEANTIVESLEGKKDLKDSIETYQELLKLNHVITIEPGIYIPDWGGVRIEDDCLIELNGCKPLNKSSKELIIV